MTAVKRAVSRAGGMVSMRVDDSAGARADWSAALTVLKSVARRAGQMGGRWAVAMVARWAGG